jgi:hypothetical protein
MLFFFSWTKSQGREMRSDGNKDGGWSRVISASDEKKSRRWLPSACVLSLSSLLLLFLLVLACLTSPSFSAGQEIPLLPSYTVSSVIPLPGLFPLPSLYLYFPFPQLEKPGIYTHSVSD